MKSFLFFFLIFISCVSFSQPIGNFNSVQPTAQTQSLVLPSTHTFQRLLRAGATLATGETAGDNFDFTGYVPIGGSSTNGYLSISSESGVAGCAILSVSLQPATKLWTISSSGNVPFPFADLGAVRAFCAGTVTPNNHIMVCEETTLSGDGNGDGYNDDGWIIEIDPATRTVINQDASGGVDKLWALGREKHEDIVIKPDGSVAYWSADNAITGYVYKFVPTVANNFSSGTLYVLQTTAALGTGTWQVVANTTVADRNNTATLGTNAGAYNFNRVEGIEFGPDGKVYFPSTTSGNIYRFRDLGATVDGLEVFLAPANFDVDGAGPFVPEPWGTGPDNIAFDGEGNLWVLQDGDRSHIWVVGANHTAASPNVRLFATTPAGSEPTGITFSPDYKYLFLSIQHPAGANAAAQTDAAGNDVVFNTATTLVIARKENLGAVVLPVRFTAFTVNEKKDGVELNWSALLNGAHDYFEIERSLNGRDFAPIGKETTSGSTFRYIDRSFPFTTLLYYRLKQWDKNGSSAYSEIKTIELKQQNRVTHLYPVPSSGELYVSYNSSYKETIRFTLINAAGKVVKNQWSHVDKGITEIKIDIQALPASTYYLRVENNGGIASHLFIKL